MGVCDQSQQIRAVTVREPGKEGKYFLKEDVIIYFLKLQKLKDQEEIRAVLKAAVIILLQPMDQKNVTNY